VTPLRADDVSRLEKLEARGLNGTLPSLKADRHRPNAFLPDSTLTGRIVQGADASAKVGIVDRSGVLT
jgi:hypothetical protein